jgi:membrane fusion protein (multidrug efflux system)
LKFGVSGTTENIQQPFMQLNLRLKLLHEPCRAENRDGKLLPGTFANVELPLDVIRDAIVVPTQAVIPVQNGKSFYF